MSYIDISGTLVTPSTENMAYEQTNHKIDALADTIDHQINSNISTVNARIDNIIAHNNDTEGNTELVDIRTGADGTVFDAAGSAVRNQFIRHEGMFGELMDYAYLSTKTTVTHNEQYEGSIIRSDGVVTSNQYTTRFVVKKYENVPVGKYSAHGYPQGSNCLYAVIGSDQTVLEYQKVGDTLTADIRDCDFYVAYEGCTVYVGGYETIEPMLYKYDKTLSLKDSLYVPQIENNNNTLNPLYNKVVTLNGDSIAYGAGCSVDGVNYGFMNFIADRNSMTLDKQAVSGGCLSVKNSESAGRHYICRTIENMEQNADYVIFEGGYNDYFLWHDVGSITETMTGEIDDTTVYGALESICRQALEKWKTAKIGFIITHKVNAAWRTVHANSSTERVTLEDYYQAIRDVCEKYSIPYLDLSKVSRLNTELDSYKTFTYNSDGIHPTQTGYETFYVPLIENWMKGM